MSYILISKAPKASILSTFISHTVSFNDLQLAARSQYELKDHVYVSLVLVLVATNKKIRPITSRIFPASIK